MSNSHGHTTSPQSTRSREASTVHVSLLYCELEAPVGTEELLPDGRALDWRGAALEVTKVRLYLRLESHATKPFLVASCNQGVAVLPLGALRPFCGPFGVGDWLLLAPGAAVNLYPSVDIPPAYDGIYTAHLLPPRRHSALVDWPKFVPNPVSFELGSEGCVPAASN